jgi:hypothetical protein
MMSYVLAQDMDSSALNWYSIAQLEEYGAPCFGCKALTPPIIAYILHCPPPLHPNCVKKASHDPTPMSNK